MKIMRLLVLACLAPLFSCMYYPVYENDYSAMRRDVFSQLVIHWNNNDQADPMNDFAAGQEAGEYFKGFNRGQIDSNFQDSSGECRRSEGRADQFVCSITRRWRFKNTGAKTAMKDVCIPGMKMVFQFSFLGDPTSHQTWTMLKISSRQDNSCPY